MSELIRCWEHYRGEGYLLTASEAWACIRDYCSKPFAATRNPREAIIHLAYESQFCKAHDC